MTSEWIQLKDLTDVLYVQIDSKDISTLNDHVIIDKGKISYFSE